MLPEAVPLRRDSWSPLVAESFLDRCLETGVTMQEFCIYSPSTLSLVVKTDWLDSSLGLHLSSADPVPRYFQFEYEGQTLGDMEPGSFAFYLMELAVLEPDVRVAAIPIDQRGIRWCTIGFRDQ